MRVLFVALGYEQLPVSLLAAILRRCGHDVGLAYSRHLFDDRAVIHAPSLARLFDDGDRDVLAQARRFRPDVVCFSSLTVNHRWMLGVARRLKALDGVTTVFGGVHASAVPDVVLADPAVDYVCVGEGDVALPLLLDALRAGPLAASGRVLPNIAYRGPGGAIVRGPQRGFIQDLDALPPFEKDLWVDHFPVGSLYLTMSSRGCPYRCTFCFNNFFANLGGKATAGNKYVRQRSVGHFIAELKEAKRRYGVRYVDILDDIFTLDAGWVREFARAYRREVGVPFKCLSHVHFLDEARVDALKEAGCEWVQMGVQSADEDYKKDSLRRSEKNTSVGRVLDLLHRAGIAVKTDHMLGLPGETDASQDKALAFYAAHEGVKRVSTFWLSYLPGTEMVDDGLRAGTISAREVEEINQGSEAFFHREANVGDAATRRRYLAYELLFRALPLVPMALRGGLRREAVEWLPAPLLKQAGTALDALNSTLHRDPGIPHIVTRYAHGLAAHARARLGVGSPPRSPLARVSDAAWDALYASAREAVDALDDAPAAEAGSARRRLPVTRA
jgi:anaerobic magnesium-protoporphyrin IX monomethyl ester cyclase